MAIVINRCGCIKSGLNENCGKGVTQLDDKEQK
jgi:hypothetical protein